MDRQPAELETLLAQAPPDVRRMVDALSRVMEDTEAVMAAYQGAMQRMYPWLTDVSETARKAQEALGLYPWKPLPLMPTLRIRAPRREARRAHRRKMKRGK